MSFKKDLLDDVLKNYKKPEDLFKKNGIFKQLKKALVERILEAELSHYLGYEKYEQSKNNGNYRNGKTSKKMLAENETIEISIPRDRACHFEPQLIGKYQRRLTGFDDKVLSLYARGMTVREIKGHIEEIYQTEVSPDLISTITDEVMDEVEEWKTRPLDSMYPILYLDAIMLKIRDNGHVQNKALYLAIGITMEGDKRILGMWMSLNEGAKFWLSVVTELKNRGVQDILIACVDGLKGFSEAINAVFPHTQIQRCIVHMIRNSLRYVPWKDKKRIAAGLKAIYTACNENEASRALSDFRAQWDKIYPTIGDMWKRNWAELIPFLAYPDYIRKVIYTTNTIESVNYGIRKITRNRSVFPDDKSAFKLVYLALNNLEKKWTRPIYNWKDALNQFAIIFGERVTKLY